MPEREDLIQLQQRVLDALSGSLDKTPHYAEQGEWVDVPIDAYSGWTDDFYDHGNWTAGFWAGMLLELEHLGAPPQRDLAETITRKLSVRADDGGTHDLGFMFRPSACALFDETGSSEWRDIGLRSADALAARFRPAGGYLQAFGALDDVRSMGTSTVDTMMNLPLLWWAWKVTGDDRYRDIAVSHADATARDIVRPDGSTFHLITHDTDGSVSWAGTYQGAGDESCWTRGQAWAVHGFITMALETGEQRFADVSEKVLDYYVSHHDLTALPPYDLLVDTGQVDASAGAIVLSGLAEALADPALAAQLDAEARIPMIRRALEEGALFADHVGLIGRSVYSLPHKLGVGGPLPYGDYYYLRAMRLLSAEASFS